MRTKVFTYAVATALLLVALLPGVASAAGNGPPDYLFGICQGRGTGGADPIVSRDPGAGYGPIVVFGIGDYHAIEMRRCIGSKTFGIAAHEAPSGDFPVQPSQKDGTAERGAGAA